MVELQLPPGKTATLQLVANPSVMNSLPVLLMSILGVLKAQKWPDLDMALVQERLAIALGSITS